MKQTYAVTGLSCGHCVKSVREALATVARDVEVTLEPPVASFHSDTPIPLEQLNRVVAGAGRYRLEPLA
jgi:copper chaperone CopZ